MNERPAYEALAFVVVDELLSQLPQAGVELHPDEVGRIAASVADAVLDAFEVRERVDSSADGA
jgi:hypothetical protein